MAFNYLSVNLFNIPKFHFSFVAEMWISSYIHVFVIPSTCLQSIRRSFRDLQLLWSTGPEYDRTATHAKAYCYNDSLYTFVAAFEVWQLTIILVVNKRNIKDSLTHPKTRQIKPYSLIIMAKLFNFLYSDSSRFFFFYLVSLCLEIKWTWLLTKEDGPALF